MQKILTIIIIIIIFIIIISFMEGIYTHIPETKYIPREYSVAAILLFLFMELISLVSVLNLLYLYISTLLLLLLLFHWHYSPLWTLACRRMSFHFCPSATNSLHLLTPSTWRSLSTSSFHPFLSLPLLLVPYSSWVKIFLDILSSSILCRWPNQLILCPFIHFTIFFSFVHLF